MEINLLKMFSQKNKEKKYSTIDENNVNDYLLNEVFHKMFETKDIVKGDSLYCPKWDVTVKPWASQLTDKSAMVEFNIYSPKWGTELYECSVGMGNDTKTAIAMAGSSFIFSFMNAVALMEENKDPIHLETEFAGKKHRWQAFLGNVVGMGESHSQDSANTYWEELKDGIVKRLGNQKLCYVKVYAANAGGEVTGECRIDDIKSDELSAVVAKMAEKWEIKQFASIKTFFLIRQEEETVTPYSYWEKDGFDSFKEKVKTAAELFYSCNTDEEFNTLIYRTANAIGDLILAEECYSFLPEICAENAFPEALYSEEIDVQFENQPAASYYKNQLSDYRALQKALFSLFNFGAFGDATDEIYKKYIGFSAIYHGVSQLLEKNGNIEGARFTKLIYNVSGNFAIR
ncbi:MAG: DUF6348 family protein [Firmicutes bacterium]|nr:DUF6348 family protein [Bacillota bacterium]